MNAQIQLKSLQYGRGLAAMAVVAFHLSLLLGSPRYLNDAVFLNFMHRGKLGVDFFFVLSGFIIVFAHHKDINQPERVSDYLLKRFTRLFPVYWLYTAIFCGLVALGFGSASIVPESFSNWISTIFLIRLDSFELPITPAWTLIHELAFYLIFATLILNRTFGIIILAAWLMTGGIVFQYTEEGSRSALTTYFSPLNFNFLIGMAAFYAFHRLTNINLKPAFLSGLVLFIFVYILENHGISYQHLQIIYAVSFGLLILGAVSYEKNGLRTTRFKILSLIGDASYTIYLTHLAFLGLFSKVMIKISAYVSFSPHFIYLAVFSATIIAGCLLYWFLERPLLQYCRTLMNSRKQSRILIKAV
ncbi:acyltransferase [Ochrobactrum sp. SFR4]|uniref:acyltransferase family protein n=1 Tax=Ochrobactrum sp. SFR4 TaxID=2717368 RepID=UPI001C8BE370|nr:acyltransferase [Ochrobactrum sp. SFR4]MBX8827143.1 acyltransferase [Ochrobactrum sp. SFR4]